MQRCSSKSRRNHFIFEFLSVLIVGAFGLWPAGLPLESLAQEPPEFWRNQPKNTDSHFIKIDAYSGERVGGSSRFDEGTEVTVYFVNINPFRYEYDFQIESRPLEIDRTVAFLELLPLPEALPSLSAVSDEGILAEDIICSRPQAESALVAISNAIIARENWLRESLMHFKTTYDQYIQSTNGPRIRDDLIPQVYEYSILLNEQLASRRDSIASWRQQVSHLLREPRDSSTVSTLSDLLNSLFENDPEGKQVCQNNILQNIDNTLMPQLRENVDNLYKPAIDTIENQDSELDELHDLIMQIIGAGESPFFATRFPETLEDPTGVSITIVRKDLRDENGQIVSTPAPRLRIGTTRRISMTAGIGISLLEYTEVIRQTGKVTLKSKVTDPDAPGPPSDSLDANGNPVSGTRSVFGLRQDSSARPLAAILLTGHFWEYRSVSIGASIGVATVLSADKDTDPEYLLGVSLGFIRNHLVVSFLCHFGRIETLDPHSKFDLGDPIPTDLLEDLPVTKSWKYKPAFVLSYRLQ